jgi:hypothetical protein
MRCPTGTQNKKLDFRSGRLNQDFNIQKLSTGQKLRMLMKTSAVGSEIANHTKDVHLNVINPFTPAEDA